MHGTIPVLTNRRGRKRKFRGSKPGGAAAVIEINPRTIAAAMPHRRALREELRHDQRAVSEVGRMCLFGFISDDMERAAGLFVGQYGSFMATVGGPRSGPGNGRGFDCPGDPDCPDCECGRRQGRYEASLAALKSAGYVPLRAVFMVAIHDRPCPVQLGDSLRCGLTALARHYGLTGGSNVRKSK